MERRRLGRTDLEITTIGFGAWSFGGDWGTQDDADSTAAIHRALELGVDWIDTAPAYGNGRSEEVIGRALSGLAERPLVFTKCGLPWDENGAIEIVDIRPETIRREIEDSLRRLRLEAVDLYQVHWPPADPRDLGDIESAWETMIAIRDEGKARFIGVSNYDAAQLTRIGKLGRVDTLQPPYSLIRRGVEEEVLPYCEHEGIGVIVYSPMASGLLSGTMTAERAASLPADDWRRSDASFQEPALSRNLATAEQVASIAARLGRSPGEVAIAWTLLQPSVAGAIVGFRRSEQVEALVSASGLELPAEVRTELDALGST
jgi:aryl-alcohol dehydrogenase-like predicted oxidoreductase